MGDASRIARPKAAHAIHLQVLVVLAVVIGTTANALSAELAQKRDVAACQALDATIRKATALSACRAANGDVAIGAGACKTVFVDQSYTTDALALGVVTIGEGGTLYVPDATVEIEAKSIVIGGSAPSPGVLQIGTANCPIGTLNPDNKVTLRLIGDRPKIARAHEHKAGDACTVIDKGIAVSANGRLLLFGARGVPPDGVSWTYLAKPAGPDAYQVNGQGENTRHIGAPVERGGETTLHLAHDVTKGMNPWKINDWIAVATTSFSPYETEFVQIAEVHSAPPGSVVTLQSAQPLRHYHFGGADPGPAHGGSARGAPSASFYAGEARNFGVDERAEVGLVTRSIVLTAKTPAPPTKAGDPSLHWGGELKFCKGYAEVALQGVELEKFGKESLGSYPIHFHMANEDANTKPPIPPKGSHLIDANSIHHSYNKCATLHSTSNITLSNNVCARIVGHIFYEEIGDEYNINFKNNLGLGAMANNFGIVGSAATTSDGLVKGWWEGDYLARINGYDGLNIRNTDNESNPVHGSCYTASGNGSLINERNPYPSGGYTWDPPKPFAPCTATEYYFEPPSGFWLVNPTALLDGNSIGGCQSLGKAYWYVAPSDPPLPPVDASHPPPSPVILYTQKLEPVGQFVNNRAHACYDGIFGENDTGVHTDQLQPRIGATPAGKNLIARFDGFTASRIRNRAVWMRPLWFVFDNARIATSREGVSLVTSGGLDGNAPGAWALLKNSVVVGLSTNNVDRWGPCAGDNKQEGPGCVDWNPEAHDLFEKGYPSPAWNFAGFYIYDGPVRIHDTRFVNFRRDIKSLLTDDDQGVLGRFTNYFNKAHDYEGDAALGWFQNNQSAYPTATEVRGLKFEHVDLRHQVFTDRVNFGTFDDGDKNTAVIDRDGSLTGFRVFDKNNQPVKDLFPISLNNLPFNASSNAVDECLSEGVQDEAAEGRPTSLISPASMATLEFGAMALPDGNVKGPKLTQFMTFTKDIKNYGEHQSMTLHSRNNQGIWEPKIASGLGYTVSARSAANDAQYKAVAGPPGIPRYISVGLTDVLKPDLDHQPFYSRIGVCYTNKDGSHPPATATFAIDRGYRSWGGNGVNYNDPAMQKYFNFLQNRYAGQFCHNLDDQVVNNMNVDTGCPADGVTPMIDACPAGSQPAKDVNQFAICVFETTTLSAATKIGELTSADGTPHDFNKYFYDANTGMLFFYVMQKELNAVGSSPLGSCTDGATDPACPNPNDPANPESYYSCPPQGCITYTVRLKGDVPYDPGESACGDTADSGRFTDPTAIYRVQDAQGKKIYEQEEPEPKNANHLVYVSKEMIVDADPKKSAQGFWHSIAKHPPVCAGTPSRPRTAGGRVHADDP